MGLLSGLGVVAGQLGKFVAKGAWEGAKAGYYVGKATGHMGKEVAKNTAKGASIAVKTIVTGGK